ncbi:MAG: hypothetical protein JW785_03605 [Acidimicrobiia bacterium]|nr:hypothetical protein [Acidimicrobiia bacterium]
MAYNPAAFEYLVVWSDGRREGTRGFDVYGRRLSAAGAAVGADFRISSNAGKADDLGPAVAYNVTANQYLVVWSDARNASTRGTDIYGRRVSATGTLIGGEFRISDPGAVGDDCSPAVAHNPNSKEYLVVWEDWRNEGLQGPDVYGQRLSPTGGAKGTNFRIGDSPGASDEVWPAVAHNPTANQYLVAWMDARNGTWDIYARRLSAAGGLLAGSTRICAPAATANEYRPQVAYNPAADEYLVVWSDERNLATRLRDIYGRRVSSAGATVGSDIRISSNGAVSHDLQAAVAYNPAADRYLVAWADKRSYATRGYDIYARRLSGTGAPVTGDFRVTGNGGVADEEWPAIAYNPTADQYLVVWQDYRAETTRGTDIFGRRVAG